jgi:hypothetical protein
MTKGELRCLLGPLNLAYEPTVPMAPPFAAFAAAHFTYEQRTALFA